METCPRCKKQTLQLVGFDKPKGIIYKKCLDCGRSIEEPFLFVK